MLPGEYLIVGWNCELAGLMMWVGWCYSRVYFDQGTISLLVPTGRSATHVEVYCYWVLRGRILSAH
jgi:hypothetical protein